MICKNCGNLIIDGEKFCSACGAHVEEPVCETSCDACCCEEAAPIAQRADDAPVDEITEVETPVESIPDAKAHADGLRIFLGAVLVIFSILPYVLPYVADNFSNSIISALVYSSDHYSVVNAIKTLLGYVEPVFYFTASMASLAAGLALLQKSRGSARLVKASLVINLVSVVFSLAVAAVVYFAPGVVVGLLGGGASLRELANEIVVQAPLVLLYLFNKTMWHLGAGIVLVVAAIIVKAKAQSKWEAAGLYEKGQRGVASLMVILPFMGLMRLLVMIFEQRMNYAQGNTVGSLSAIATSLITSSFGTYILAAAVLGVVVAVLGHRVRFWKLCAGYTVIVAAAAAVAITYAESFALTIVRAYSMPMEYFALMSNALMAYLAVTAIMLIAYSVWMAASARGAIAIWLQPLLAVVYMAAYVALEMVKPELGFAFYIQLGCFGASVLMIIVSCVAAGIAKRKNEIISEESFVEELLEADSASVPENE